MKKLLKKNVIVCVTGLVLAISLFGCAQPQKKPVTPTPKNNIVDIIAAEKNLIGFKNIKQFQFVDIAVDKAKTDDDGSFYYCLDCNNITFDKQNNVAIYIRGEMFEPPKLAKQIGVGNGWTLFVEKADFNNNTVKILSSCRVVNMNDPMAKEEKAVHFMDDRHGNHVGMVHYKKYDNAEAININTMEDRYWQKLVLVIKDEFMKETFFEKFKPRK